MGSSDRRDREDRGRYCRCLEEQSVEEEQINNFFSFLFFFSFLLFCFEGEEGFLDNVVASGIAEYWYTWA